ncbi:acyl-CoA dehydrogenase family protein [Micrococcales bacterium 31B]|nr:acyl-CoA dehydrogenase family protein [Micrococcales bacterium 31B]
MTIDPHHAHDPQHWLATAERVRDELARDALERDRANAEPHAELDLLRDSGLFALLVPTEHGGPGNSWATAARVVHIIAQADASIAQLFLYHLVNLNVLRWIASPETQQHWYQRTLSERLIWADAVNPTDPELTLNRRSDGGFTLAGTKNFATGSSVADIIICGGVSDHDGHGWNVVVPTSHPGVRPHGNWDNLGQRLTASGTVTFEQIEVGPEAVIGTLNLDVIGAYGSLVGPVIQYLFGALYLGVARGALDLASEYTRTSSRPWVLSDVDSATADPYVLATYGDLHSRVLAGEALAWQTGERVDAAEARGSQLTWHERGELAAVVAALKVFSSDTSLAVTSAIFEVTGARSTANRYGFDRFWRNVRTHSLHDPVAYKKREVGDHFVNGTHVAFSLYT